MTVIGRGLINVLRLRGSASPPRTLESGSWREASAGGRAAQETEKAGPLKEEDANGTAGIDTRTHTHTTKGGE